MKISRPNSSRFERINKIASLISSSPHSISELASKLNVSTKSIQRDLYEVLSHHGAVREGRLWSINAQNDPLKAGEEGLVLSILQRLSKSFGAEFYFKASLILKDVAQQLSPNLLSNLEFERLEHEHLNDFLNIENAIAKSKIINATYNDFSFTLKPLRLAIFDGFWYLLALDKDDKFKKFHLKSLKNIKLSQQSFSANKEFLEKVLKAKSAWFDPANIQTARLLLDKSIAKYFLRKPLASQLISGKDNDGSVEIELSFSHETEILPTIKQYLPHIKILSPKWLNDMLINELKSYLAEINHKI